MGRGWCKCRCARLVECYYKPSVMPEIWQNFGFDQRRLMPTLPLLLKMTSLTETYVTTLDGWALGKDAREARTLLEQQQKYGFIGDEHIGLTRIKGKPATVTEFELGARLPQPDKVAVPATGETVIIPTDGEFDLRRHFSSFGMEYSFLDKTLLLLAAENERCYVIQSLQEDLSLIQWATHRHDPEKENIFRQAEHLVCRRDMGPLLIPYAFIHKESVLALGEVTKAITGHYFGVNRKN